VLSAGAPLPDALCRRAEARLGCEVRQGYGLTEASFSTIDAPPAPRTIGSVGRPVAGVEVRIAADGEVEVRGPHVMAGYLDGTPAPVDAGGWLRTGDLGRLDDDGYLWVEGRRDDLIVSGGENVRPDRVEAALLEHPAVAEVAVAGREDRRWGQAVTAFVVAAGDLDTDELIVHARSRLAPHEVPKTVELVTELPRTGSGKVLRRLLV